MWLNGRSVWLVFRRSWVQVPARFWNFFPCQNIFIYLLDVTPSNSLPLPLSPPSIPLCIIQVKDWVPPTNMRKWPEAVSMLSCFVLQWDARFQLLLNRTLKNDQLGTWHTRKGFGSCWQDKIIPPVPKHERSLSNNPCNCVKSAAVLLTRAHPSVALEQNET